MKNLRINHVVVVLLLSAASAFATHRQANAIMLCNTIPSSSGPSIDNECAYSPSLPCCYIAAGSTAQFVIQTQNGNIVTIRRNTSSMVTIYGIRQ